MMEPMFLTTDDVIALHAAQLERFGGAAGLRDRGLLDSAVAQPQATFDGVLVHNGLFEMAAAYLFHLVSNHAFVDGNKRAGLLAAITFLELNGVSVSNGSALLYALTMGVAEGNVRKSAVASQLAAIAGLSR
jgi:death on curing protein